MTTGKGISSLYAPLGAVTVSDRVNEPFAAGKAFVHGFTNMGHPVACAIGSRVIDILREDGLVENCALVSGHFDAIAPRLLDHPTLVDLRGAGLLKIGELVKNKETREFFGREAGAETLFQSLALKNGLAFYGTLYGSRRTPGFKRGLPIFIAPPLCITTDQMDDLIERLDTTLSEWETALGVS